MSKKEIFKDIKGYEGLYQVSNLGNVKSLGNDKAKKERILKTGKNIWGYLYVILRKNRKGKITYIHRLVANTFIPNVDNLPQVNHKDENKENNCADNLEWCNAKYNNTYGTCIQRRVANTDYKTIAEKQKNDPNRSKKVYQHTLDGKLIKIWESINECKRNGYNQGNVAACCRNCFNREGNNVYKGYIWSYTEIKN